MVSAQERPGCHRSGVLISLVSLSQPSESSACWGSGSGLFQGHLAGSREDDWHADSFLFF